jgi:hypothetical protein
LIEAFLFSSHGTRWFGRLIPADGDRATVPSGRRAPFGRRKQQTSAALSARDRHMRARIAVATLFLIGTTSCYLPPSGQPPADRAAFVRQQAWLVWGNILDHLQQRVAAFNEATMMSSITFPRPGRMLAYSGGETARWSL